MEVAGIVPEEDLQEEQAESEPEPAEEGEERLSVFEDFLEKLEMEDDESNDEEEGSEDKN
jgi:hypothetical protein